MFGFDSTPLVVLLASVLKPVDDTRMRGKFAKTLLDRPHTQVHIAGRGPTGGSAGSPIEAEVPRLFLHPIFNGSRLSLGRLAAQWRYWRLLHRLAPAVVIVHAPELLPLTLLWHGLGRKRNFLYDIRENYALNVSTQRVYGRLARRLLSASLGWVETQAARRAVGLLLAEASYADELPFLQMQVDNRVVILENKYQAAPDEFFCSEPRLLPLPHEPLRLLYSGTISELNGVWEAIAVAEQLRAAWPGGARLTIVGFCQQPALLRQLQAKIAHNPLSITLIGGDELVPHARIVAEIALSHLGLLPYRPHPSTECCRPTKLFEYLAHGLTVIASPNPLWQAQLDQYAAGLPLDFTQPVDGPALVARLRRSIFYPAGVPKSVLWADEGKKLWLLLDSVV